MQTDGTPLRHGLHGIEGKIVNHLTKLPEVYSQWPEVLGDVEFAFHL